MTSHSDLNAALLCQILYDRPSYFDRIIDIGGVYAGFKLISGIPTFVFRGSTTAQDWLRDLESIEIAQHPALGPVGKGFVRGIDEVFEFIQRNITLPDEIIHFYGHSLGGPHAAYMAGLFISAGYKAELVMFEPARSCGQKMMAILTGHNVRCYRNGDDPVPIVPLGLYHPSALIQLDCDAVPGDITPLKRHHMPLIITAIALRENGFYDSTLST